MSGAKLIQVIETTIATRGGGRCKEDPVRRVTQYWATDGTLLAEVDDWRDALDVEALQQAAKSLLDVMAAQGIGGNLDGYTKHLRDVLRRSTSAPPEKP